jgi:ribonuclease-3
MNLDLNKLEKLINIKFKNQKILKQCLTHKSHNSLESNEKLEFLGDRVLGLVISKKLYEKYPDDKEGSLDKKLASLVNKKKCLEIAKSINLEKFIFIGNSKNKITKIEDKIISDTCESLIGAIYLDKGIDVTQKFILNLWNKHIDLSEKTYVDPKTKLQEYSLKKYKSLPVYKLLENSGPKHKPIFKIGVRLKNSKLAKGTGSSKKEAEQNAALILLTNLNKK